MGQYPVSRNTLNKPQKSSQKEVLWSSPRNSTGTTISLAFINDLPEVVKISDARLFADDYLLYRHIRNDTGSSDLQVDISAHEDWEARWQMRLHPEKCTAIRVYTNKRLGKNTSYKLHDHTLDIVDYSKYLGVNISEDFGWKKQVDYTAAKASLSLGFLRCNLRDCRREVRSAAYSSMVQPTLDYTSTTCDPHTKEDINTLDKVQHRGTRFVRNNYTDRTPGCDTAMLNSLIWISLSTRRYNQRLFMLYKIQHNQVDTADCSINDRRTKGTYRLYQPHAMQSIYKYSFFRERSMIGTAYLPLYQTAHR